MDLNEEIKLIQSADAHASDYLRGCGTRRVFPSRADQAALSVFEEPFPQAPSDPQSSLAMLARYGSPATVLSNGPNYYGFVLGGVLPAAAAADRMVAAWDQCSSSPITSPAVAAIEKVAAGWLLEALDLPRESAVGFGTSATACGLTCVAAARRSLLAKLGWDIEQEGLNGGPRLKVVLSHTVHVTVYKILKVLGFGKGDISIAPTDEHGRILAEQMPPLDDHTLLCLQAGEVNKGEFDPFLEIIPKAKSAGAWVHVDGAFGLWARASKSRRHLTEGIEQADSWTTDGHKWLNTPYDSAMAICRDRSLLASTLSANAAYSAASVEDQQSLTLEFSRRGRGVPVWAALHCLGRVGLEDLVDQYCERATQLARGCRKLGIPVLNRVVLNQVLCAFDDPDKTRRFIESVQEGGKVWFGGTTWDGQPAFRLSVSSWRTTAAHIQECIAELERHLEA